LDEVRPRCFRLARLVFGANDDTVAAVLSDIVADGGSEIKRRNPEGGADFDDTPRLEGTAKLVAELRLVAVQRHELVAAKLLDLFFTGCVQLLQTARLKFYESRSLCIALGMQR
jgi:hypothetical protein